MSTTAQPASAQRTPTSTAASPSLRPRTRNLLQTPPSSIQSPSSTVSSLSLSSPQSNFSSLIHRRCERDRHKRIKKENRKTDRNGKQKRWNRPCVYCIDDWKVRKASGASVEKWDKEVKRTEFVCSVCNVFLCAAHFEAYHDRMLGPR